MAVKLASVAENLAKEAENLPAFSGLNLLHIKRNVALMLEQIGRNGIFDQYTKHDISHIDAMLKMLDDWIVPPSTKDLLTTADWLLVVLSIYFHDLGMLITKDEYNARNSSAFPEFRDKSLISQDGRGKDYEDRLKYLSAEDRRRFLYQEFVRHHHAARIRSWIVGMASSDLGVSQKVASIIDETLSVLDPTFRNKLGMVCESYHDDDLDDFVKYKTSHPFGNSHKETANL